MEPQHSSIGHELTSSNVAGVIFAHPRRHTSANSPGLGTAFLPGRRPRKADAAGRRQDADMAAKFLVDVFARRAIWRKFAGRLLSFNASDGEARRGLTVACVK
ncbi:hypothetical protein, partial [Mesorhizobium sp. M2C.T.Ca.TU.002.02.1.1]|uniref:hypothetical protein n=1 Tax=Mesorhizobium sp. M2C.T.Ca.TU.002.02.1.1 TaxID=2496788 RepID=UPI0019D14A36